MTKRMVPRLAVPLMMLVLTLGGAAWLQAAPLPPLAAPQAALAAPPPPAVQPGGIPGKLEGRDAEHRASAPGYTTAPSPLQPLSDPVFGPNTRANTDTTTYAQQEPSIAVNPTNPLNIIASAKDERSAPSPNTATKEVWEYASTDGGLTWANVHAPIIGTHANRQSDPVNIFRDDGVAYACYLGYNDSAGYVDTGIYVARSTDGGFTWNNTVLPVNEGSGYSTDKQWLAVDNNPSSPFYHRMYLSWTEFGGCNACIHFVYSTDGGLTWSPQTFQLSTGGNQQFSMPTVLANGNVFVNWANGAGIAYRISTDGGVTFSTQASAGTMNTNLAMTGQNWRISAIPVAAADQTTPGNLVITWNDGRNNATNGVDIYYVRSTNGGTVWSAPARLNDDPAALVRHQAEPWVTTSPDGTFHAIWYDEREDTTTNVIFHIYYTQSTDGGATWRPDVRISDATTNLNIGIPAGPGWNGAAGDYINVSATNSDVYGVWTDTRSGTNEDIYVARGHINQGTPTPTVTGTPPTATQTRTPTQTPLATATATATATVNPCLVSTYTVATGTATIVPGTTDIGSACDDCDTPITLPFPFTLYGQSFSTVNASSNGRLDFATANEPGGYTNTCLPAAPNVGPYDYTIFALWDDQLTTGTGHGIFTSVSGSAPNRIFNIEWRACLYSGGSCGGDVNYEVRLYEGSTRFDLVYGTLGGSGTGATTGVQGPSTFFTQYSCNTALTSGLLLTFTQPPCGTPTVGPSSTATVPPTTTRTATSAASATATATAIPTSCPVQFVDVPPGSTFYDYVRCLACRGIVGGYPCGGPGEPCPGNYYRPNNNVTRGQVSKIVSESAGFHDVVPSSQQTFEDVAPGSTFALWIERLAVRGIIGGYPCGGPFEPCVAPTNRPYFRPNNNVTRGQLSKITSGAAGWSETPTGQTFEDVAPGSTFYLYIERMSARGIISGYPCGNPGEPCVSPGNRPYFRPNNNATRGQMAKIAAAAFFPNCSTPVRR